jgi:hypothetical protein
MTVTPHEWISWSDARWRMPEIWDGWRYRTADADQALVNSLRRGNVSYRLSRNDPYAGTYEDSVFAPFMNKKIDLRDVVAGLLMLQFYRSPIRAEYETEELAHMPGWSPVKRKLKLTAAVYGAELAWDELRNDLILFELPAGAQPNQPKSHRTAARHRREPIRPAPSGQIHQAITEVYNHAMAAGDKPPNVNEITIPVQKKLRAAGYKASGRKIRELAGHPKHAARRWKPGRTRKSKKSEAER